MEEPQLEQQISPEMKQMAGLKAKSRANKDKWNRDITVFSFTVLVIVLILLAQDVAFEIVATVAIIGLLAVWLMGWKLGRDMYANYYDEELANILQRPEMKEPEPEEDTIDEKVRKAVRDMWR